MATEYARAKSRRRAQSSYYRKKSQIMEHYGGVCCIGCGETEMNILQLHHTNNNGTACRKEARVTTSSYTYWNWLIKHGFPSHHKQEVLCRNCHMKETLTTIEHGPPVRLKPRSYASLINPHDIPFKRQIKYAKYIRKDDPNFIPQYPEVIRRLRSRAEKDMYAPYWHIRSLEKSGFDVTGLYVPDPCKKRKKIKKKRVAPKKRVTTKKRALTNEDKLKEMFGIRE